MSDRSHCPQCGAALSAPGGQDALCPACLLRHGLSDLEETIPAPGPPTGPEAPTPETIGPYRVLRKIGEGGMGVVYLARQSGEIERDVAIKLVKLGVNSKQVLARFQMERRSLALMQHPGIARIFDAGTADDGQPYFVMEYVEGESITTFCDRRRLPNIERIRLFREVCRAVQHAHQKGVIHRDLKPSNILVEDSTEGPRPKIIDFGVAKATGQSYLEWSVFTEIGRLVGTPEYMSPEQAGDSDRDVDTRTDVYSLGVVLYELLVGVTPLESTDLREAGLQALLRTVREATFPTPSSRLQTLAGSGPVTAENRRTDGVALARELRGELDWIVMRALEREKNDRYESPSELAQDLQRYLEDEPVVAGPPGTVYRLRKFARRHRTAVAVAATMLTLLMVGLVSTTLMWTRATRERDRADAGVAQVLRLADRKRLADYSAAADRLWPAHPDRIEELSRWLEQKGRPLAARLELHQETLEALRAEALPYDDEQRRLDLRTHPRAQELADEREYHEERIEYLTRAESNPGLEDRDEIIEYRKQQIERSAARIEQLEQLVQERRTWRFRDEETQWQHQMLTELVEELERFTDPDPFVGIIAGVQKRLEFAQGVMERTITGAEIAGAWHEATTKISASPLYGGLELVPQIGLVPLGEDPESGLWEFWHVESGERPLPSSDPAAANHWVVNGKTGMVLVLIPPGSFWMGAQNGDPGGRNYDSLAERRERPVMQIELAAFFLSKYEMTQGQWKRLSGENPSDHSAGGGYAGHLTTEAHPVEMVSWFDASDLLSRHGLMLPTEAQWEYAVRAGTETSWWTGKTRRSLQGWANIADRFLEQSGAPNDWTFDTIIEDGYGIHAPVGTYRPNPFGLHDTLGNLREWCREHYRSPYTDRVDPGDGYRKVPGGTRRRVTRGGSWRVKAGPARSAARGSQSPEYVDSGTGVRPARSLGS